MIRDYEFKVRLNPSDLLPILHVKVLKRTYPIDFTEINIPMIVKRENEKLDYCLDFARSFDSDGHEYREAYRCRTKERELLSMLENHMHPYIADCLAGKEVLAKNGKKFKFSLDDGYNPGRCGFYRGKRCRTKGSLTSRKRCSTDGN